MQKVFMLEPIEYILNSDEAAQIAKDFQSWSSEQNLSYAELAEYSSYFTKLADKFNLTEEFKENGII